MPADWRKQGFDPNLLANRLEKTRHVDSATRVVSFRGFEVEEVVTILHSALDFAENMPEAVQRRIIMDAAFAKARAGRITASNLLREIQKQEASYARLPQERYVLSTSLSVRYFPSLTSTEVSGHRVTYGSLPDRFHRAYEGVRSQAEAQILGPRPDRGPPSKRYTPVRISVRARSQDEAMEEALGAVGLLRGMWNYSLNRTVGMRTSGGQRNPVNRIVLGPLHCLHHPTGELTCAGTWIDTDYAEPIKPYNLSRDWPTLKPRTDQIKRAIASCPYREELEDAILRYVQALDQRGWNTSFLQLWGVLETLTDTSRDRYEVTVSRVLFLTRHDRRDFDRQILRHLITYRNKTIHAGYETSSIEILLYQLKRYVEDCLAFHLWWRPRFGSIGEAARFLDLPPDPERLQERSRIFRRALRLQESLRGHA